MSVPVLGLSAFQVSGAKPVAARSASEEQLQINRAMPFIEGPYPQDEAPLKEGPTPDASAPKYNMKL